MPFMNLHSRSSSRNRESFNNPSVRRRKPRPEWDSTLNDLNQMKASPEEVAQRKYAHMSKNLYRVRQQKEEDLIAKARKQAVRSGSQRGLTGILREVFYNEDQYDRLLSQTRQALQTASSLYGDDGKRSEVTPSITMAPSDDEGSVTGQRPTDGLIQTPRSASQLEKLSGRVMRQTALNDSRLRETSYGEDSEEEDAGPYPMPSYQAILDLPRFQHLLQGETPKPAPQDLKSSLRKDQPKAFCKSKASPIKVTIQPSSVKASLLSSDDDEDKENTQIMAANATGKVKKTRSKVTSAQKVKVKAAPPYVSREGEELQELISRMNNEFEDYESNVALMRVPSYPISGSYSGCTLSLLDKVTKLVHYLKQNALQLEAEKTVREQLAQDVTSQARALDSLAMDFDAVQQELQTVRMQFDEYREESKKQITDLTTKLNQVTLTRSAHLARSPHRYHGPITMSPKKVMSPKTPVSPALLASSSAVNQLPSPSKGGQGSAAMVTDQPKSELDSQLKTSPPVYRSHDSSSFLQKQIQQLTDEHARAQEKFNQLQQLQNEMRKEKPSP